MNKEDKFTEEFKISDEYLDRLKEIDFSYKVGKTQHESYKEYYNQELIDLVANSEQMIIDRFGYKW